MKSFSFIYDSVSSDKFLYEYKILQLKSAKSFLKYFCLLVNDDQVNKIILNSSNYLQNINKFA